ncbi:MAG TPA: GTPase, partial [Gammaproteobacteria bacterium]|nr:GTPase [Gammaproteobacteria bacterium]
MNFTVAITGRPNVGKSTLFNRLVGKRAALVHDEPGVTRDRREGEARLADLTFKVIDTAGLDEVSGENLEARIQQQTEVAIDEANISLFLIDAQTGITPLDEHFADVLRRRDATTIVVANKCDSAKSDDGYYDAFSLGLG